jgi:uncharacterized membrane protein HdeD (DUF308 family)
VAAQQLDGRLWRGFALRGALAILFGILAFARPDTTATALVYLFGAYAFIDGIAALATSVNVAEERGHWVPILLVGLVGIIIGILSFSRPAATAVGLVSYVGAWAIITGILEFVGSFRLRKVVDGEWLLAVAGLLSIAFGIMISARPAAGMLSLVWIIGAYAVIFGALELALAFRLRGVQRRLQTA